MPILSPSPRKGPVAPAPDDHDHVPAHALAARRVAAAGAAPWGSPALSSPCPFRGGPQLVRPARCEPRIQNELCQHVTPTGYTSPFIRTHLFPNPAHAGRCTSGGRAGRLRAALEADLIFVEVALDPSAFSHCVLTAPVTVTPLLLQAVFA